MAARTRKKKGGFWETEAAKAVLEGRGGKHLTAAEKNALIDDEAALELVAVKYDEKNQFQGSPMPRYLATFLVDGVERYWGFATSTDDEPSSRDLLLEALAEYIEEDGSEPVFLTPFRSGANGQFIALRKADV